MTRKNNPARRSKDEPSPLPQRVPESEVSSGQRRQTHKRPRQRQQRYQDLLDQVSDLVHTTDPQGRLQYANRAWQQALGYGAAEIADLSLFDLVHPRSESYLRQVLERVLSGQQADGVQAEFRTRDGRTVTLEGTMNCELVSGTPVQTQGIFRQVTPQSQDHEPLNERLKELACLYAVSRDMQQQLSVDEFCRRVVQHLIPAMQFPEIAVPVIELHDRRFSSRPRRKKLSHGLHAPIGVAGQAEGQLSVYYTEQRPFLLPYEQNLLDGVAEALGTWLERTQTQQRLQQSAEKYRLITDNTDDLVAITTFDRNPTLTYASPSHQKLLGYEPADLLGKPALAFVHPDDKKTLQRLLKTYLQARAKNPPAEAASELSETIEYRVTAASGDLYWMESTVNMAADGLLLLSRDVTERKKHEEAERASAQQIARSNRLLLGLCQAVKTVQSAHTAAEVYRTVLDELSLLGYHGAIFTFTEDREHLTPSYLTFEPALVEMGEKLVGLSAEGYRIPIEPAGLYDRIMQQGEPSFSERAVDFIDEALPGSLRHVARRLAALLGLERVVRVPLAAGAEVYGLLTVSGCDLREADVPAITAFAHQTAVAVDNARLYQEAQTRAAELAASEARYRSLFDNARDGLFLIDMQGEHIDANRAACELLGYSREELLELDVFQIGAWPPALSPERRDRHLERLQALWSEGVTGYETELLTSSGQPISVEMTITPLPYRGQQAVMAAVRDVTARKQAEVALRESEEAYRQLVDNANDIIYTHDLAGNFTSVNPAALRTYGYTAEEVQQLNIADIVDPGYLPLAQQKMRQKLEGPARTEPYELLTHSKQGQPVWVEVNTRLLTREGQPIGVQGVARDITSRKQVEDALRESEQRYRTLFDSASDAIFIHDLEGHFLEVNQAACERLGYTREELLHISPMDIDTVEYAVLVPERIEELRQRGHAFFETVHVRRDGTTIPTELSSRIIDYGGRSAVLTVARDISERKEAEETIKRLAYHDPLTGLPNRILFSDRLSVALAEARRSQRRHAVMLLDLDHFKKVNDTLGHTMGDRLLRAVGERLTSLLRESDTICRMGGDEFLLSLRGIARPEDGLHVADKIVEAIRKPFTLDGQELHITTSLGIAVYPEDGQDVSSLIKNADLALYRAKEEGRDNYQRYTASNE